MVVQRRRHGSVEQITAGRRVFGVLPVTSHFYRVGTVLVDAGPPTAPTSCSPRSTTRSRPSC